MSYISLYRKYRPARFTEIIGQPHVVAAILGALSQDKISHAFLFAGPRGTGKTSAARILSRAINCKDPKDYEPCNNCLTCKSLLEGKSLDLLEIDAASNRGIEEIRSLREKVNFAATNVKYKVFIIDEVHMLTKEAFNALLKTLEEPPANTVFILATTEIHKLPETIISRCQRFDFRRISEIEIANHLKTILTKEKVEFEEAAVKMIAKSAHGGMRDAESMLDQLASVGGTLTYERTLSFLGILDEEAIINILTALAAGKAEKIFEAFSQMSEKGVHWPNLANQIIASLRKVILALILGQEAKEFSKEEFEQYAILARSRDLLFWQKAIESFLNAENSLKFSPVPELCLEIAVMKTMEGISVSKTPNIQEPEKPEIKNETQPNDAKVTLPENGMLQQVRMHWGEALVKIGEQSPALHGLLRLAKVGVTAEGNLNLVLPRSFHIEQIKDSRNLILLSKTLAAILGKEVNFSFSVEKNTQTTEDIIKTAKQIFSA